MDGTIKTGACIFIIIGIYFAYRQAASGIDQLKLKSAVKENNAGNNRKALEIIKSLNNDLGPSDIYHRIYGNILIKDKLYAQALPQFEAATLYTSDPDLFLNIGRCYFKLGKLPEAEQNFRLAHNITPGRITPLYELLQVKRQLKDTLQMVTLAHQIIEMQPKVPSKEADYFKKGANMVILQYEKIKHKNLNN